MHNDEDIELICQNLVDIALKAGRSIGLSKRHYLIFEMAVLDVKNFFLLIALIYSHLVISASQVQLGESFG